MRTGEVVGFISPTAVSAAETMANFGYHAQSNATSSEGATSAEAMATSNEGWREKRDNEIATHCRVWLVRSTDGMIQYPVSVQRTVETDKLQAAAMSSHLLEIIKKLHGVGLNVVAVVGDLHATNTAFRYLMTASQEVEDSADDTMLPETGASSGAGRTNSVLTDDNPSFTDLYAELKMKWTPTVKLRSAGVSDAAAAADEEVEDDASDEVAPAPGPGAAAPTPATFTVKKKDKLTLRGVYRGRGTGNAPTSFVAVPYLTAASDEGAGGPHCRSSPLLP